jgi:hypothetical protein
MVCAAFYLEMCHMILWINGAYGVGKSTTANALQKHIPNSFIFDPEMIGNCVRETKPDSLWRDDFQIYPSWREMTCTLLAELSKMYSGTIIVPMTILNRDYLHEIIDPLREAGVTIYHFILEASSETIGARIISRKEDESCWCYRQIPRCVAALKEIEHGITIHTDHKPVDEIVAEIIHHTSEGGNTTMFAFTDQFNTISGPNGMTLSICEKCPGDEVMIPFYYYDILVNDVPVGKISIRIGDNAHSYWNGHVGYEIDPPYRGNHYSLDALRQVLQVARFHGMTRIYLTCDESNTASRKIIEAAGAALVETAVPPETYFAWRPDMKAQCVYELKL